jgi:hypothetical protein
MGCAGVLVAVESVCCTSFKCTAAGSGARMRRCAARHCAARTAQHTGADARRCSCAGVMLAISACCTRSGRAAITRSELSLLAGTECAASTKKGQVLSWTQPGLSSRGHVTLAHSESGEEGFIRRLLFIPAGIVIMGLENSTTIAQREGEREGHVPPLPPTATGRPDAAPAR